MAFSSSVISQHVVHLDTKLQLKEVALCGVSCSHAIAVIFSKGWSPKDFVDECYTQKKYIMAYKPMINPIADVSE